MKELISAREKLAIKLLLLLEINNIKIIGFFLVKKNGILNINRLDYNSSSSLFTLRDSSFLASAATAKNN